MRYGADLRRPGGLGGCPGGSPSPKPGRGGGRATKSVEMVKVSRRVLSSSRVFYAPNGPGGPRGAVPGPMRAPGHWPSSLPEPPARSGQLSWFGRGIRPINQRNAHTQHAHEARCRWEFMRRPGPPFPGQKQRHANGPGLLGKAGALHQPAFPYAKFLYVKFLILA